MDQNAKTRRFRFELALGLLLILSAAPVFAQTVVYRIDPAPVMTTSGTASAGFPTAYLVPNATIKLYTNSAATILATAYTDATGVTTCAPTAPVTLPGTSVCTPNAGAQGQFGFWVQPGTYYYTVTTVTGTFGPYPISSPTVGTLGGSGIVSSNTVGGLVPQVNHQDCSVFPGVNAGAKLAACIDALSVDGGIADTTNIVGAQNVSAQVVISTSNVTVLFGCATYTLLGVSPQQGPPFIAAVFQVNNASNVWFRGNGQCSVLKLGSGETANVFTWYGASTGGGFTGLELDGNKSNNTSGSDDTFQSGVEIIESTASGATQDARITVDNNLIHDFNHDGIVTYGEQANANILTNNWIYSNGKADTFGTGYGIGINKSSSRNFVSGNHVHDNQRSGIWLTTAGLSQTANTVANNFTYGNGRSGIFAEEEMDLGSSTGASQTRLIIQGNQSYSNVVAGIEIAVNDTSSGPINDAIISGNQAWGNAYGIAVNGSGTSASVNTTIVEGNQLNFNSSYGFIANSNAFSTTLRDNVGHGNTSGNISDSGTRTVNCGNLINTGDASYPCLSSISAFGGALFPNKAIASFLEPAVRTWTMQANSGNLQIFSGDGSGSIATGSSGIITALLTASSVSLSGVATITSGAGAPGGSCVTGSLYLRTNGGTGTTLYVCESAAWVGK